MDNSNWFESYNHPNNAGSCKTYNGNQGCNGVVKSEDTLKKLLPLASFLFGISILIKFNANINFKPFATQPSVTLSQWTLGLQLK